MKSLTRLFDDLYIAPLIHKDQLGQTIFYPMGFMSRRGYLLPSEREAGLKLRLRQLLFASWIGCMAVVLLGTRLTDSGYTTQGKAWLIMGILFAAWIAIVARLQFRLTAGLEPKSERVSARDWLQESRRSRARWTNWAYVISGALCVIMAIIALSVGVTDTDVAVIISAVVLLPLGLLAVWDGRRGLREGVAGGREQYRKRR